VNTGPEKTEDQIRIAENPAYRIIKDLNEEAGKKEGLLQTGENPLNNGLISNRLLTRE